MPEALAPRPARLPSIDIVRGLVMVLMALDHARTFASEVPFPPEDMQHTNLALFFTRWVTHFCAPLFFLLAGLSARLYERSAGGPALRRFLWTRGLWLIALELTVIGFSWSFQPGGHFLGVIWCLGWAFLSLAALTFVGPRAALVLGVAFIALHDLLDDVGPEAFGPAGFLYGIAHQANVIEFPWGGHDFVLFPWIPWVCVAWLGYGLGALFLGEAERRRRVLLVAGGLMCAAFLFLRTTNLYGNPSWAFQRGGPGHFAPQESASLTLIALLNTEKYPPSLQFLLMTLGPSFLLLGLYARKDERGGLNAVERALAVFGRTPFLFYVLHLYLLHLGALGAGALWGNPPRGRFALPGVYALWIAGTALLFPVCAWWARLRARRGDWWLKYL